MPVELAGDQQGSSVSVVIPLYNAAEVVERAVASVQAQTRSCAEIILVDDGSTDETRAVVERLAKSDIRIKLVFLEKNGGAARARNQGFAAATGDWIAILDADDVWLPERIEKLMAAAMLYGANFVTDNFILHDQARDRDHRLFLTPDWEVLNLDQRTYWENCRFGAPLYSLLKMMLRRDLITETGLRYDEECGQGQDLIFVGEALALGARAIIIAQAYYVYSTRIGGYSGRRNKHSKTQMNFARLVTRIEALLERRRTTISSDARRAALRSAENFRTVDRLNAYRAARRAGRMSGWTHLLLDAPALALMVKMRHRDWVTSRPAKLLPSSVEA